MVRSFLRAILPLFAGLMAQAQVVRPAPSNFVFDGSVSEWEKSPSTLGLQNEGNVRGELWLGYTSRGLIVAGKIDDTGWHLARSVSELSTQGRLEISLSLVHPVELPPIGWGNQFGERAGTEDGCNNLDAPQDRANCMQWARKQPAYRIVFQKLFARKWRVAPDIAEEVLATSAFETLPTNAQKKLEMLRPTGNLSSRFRVGKDFRTAGNFTFEVLLPWNALPPADHLDLDRISFRLDWFEGENRLLSTADTSRTLPLDGLPWLTLFPAPAYRITPCEMPLSGVDMQGNQRRAYYLPGDAFEARAVFLIENESRGYQYAPLPDALSPSIRPLNFFAQSLGADEALCGPDMAYRRGNVVKRFPYKLGPEKYFVWQAAQTKFPIKTLPNGTRLIKAGPLLSYEEFRSGACGGCPFADLAIYALDRDGNIHRALGIHTQITPFQRGYEIEVSPDWKKVTIFETGADDDRKEPGWSSSSQCLVGNDYRLCGESANCAPPKDGILKALLSRN